MPGQLKEGLGLVVQDDGGEDVLAHNRGTAKQHAAEARAILEKARQVPLPDDGDNALDTRDATLNVDENIILFDLFDDFNEIRLPRTRENRGVA